MKNLTPRFILIIVDGWGLRNSHRTNAFSIGRTPVFDRLLQEYPWARLEAAGTAVGLPDGVIGNSEVGHLTIGAGRIVRHDLVRIHDAVRDGSLGQKPELRSLFDYVKGNNASLHLLGLLSDAGVHSHIDHVFAILKIAKQEGLERVYLHAITDGRDTSPTAGIDYVRRTISHMEQLNLGQVVTVVGRYYAMDRDRRWDRTEIAYRALVAGEGQRFEDPVSAVRSSYDENVTDEFITPRVIGDRDDYPRNIRDTDALFCFNFRADRMRQITRALGGNIFEDFSRLSSPVFITSMTSYDGKFAFPVLFKPITLGNIFGEVLENHGLRQVRVAETEKYAHVTYFFNGGDELAFPHEDRILVPSPKVPTYDLKPEMSVSGIGAKVRGAIESGEYDAIIMNLANPDMVGHTGSLDAAVKAVEAADAVVGEVTDLALEKGAVAFVTADHGNAEMMEDERTGKMHTAHTLNPVPFIVVSRDPRMKLKAEGDLADVAPTILDYLRLSIPAEMTGESLFVSS